MIASDQRQRPVAVQQGRVLLIGLALPASCSPSPWHNSCRQRLARERSWRTDVPGLEVESPSRPGVSSVLDVSFRPPVDRWRLRLRGPVQVGAAPTRSERAWRRPTHFQRSRIGLPRARRGR